MEFKFNSNREVKNVNNKYNIYGYFIIVRNKYGFLFCVVM